MVDPTKNIGSIQNILSNNRTQSAGDRQKEAREAERREAPQDEVFLSEEALSIQQAQEVAEQTRAQLERSEESLGLDPNFDQEA